MHAEHKYHVYYSTMLDRFRTMLFPDTGEIPPPPEWTEEDEERCRTEAIRNRAQRALDGPEPDTEAEIEKGEEVDVETKCPYCPRWFKSRTASEAHIWAKAGMGLHPELKEEEKAEYGEGFYCTTCNKCFRSESALDAHLYSKGDEEGHPP